MKFKRSLSSFFFFVALSAVSLTIISMTSLWIFEKIRNFKEEVQKTKKSYLDYQKDIIKNQVDLVVDYINYMKHTTENRLKHDIKDRVYEAYNIAKNIYLQNIKTKPKEEIKKMIVDALRPIKFNNGRGYYFATRLDGINILFADKPEMEGSNLLEIQDTNGKYVNKDFAKIVTEYGEGYYQYTWTKPNAEGNNFKRWHSLNILSLLIVS